jgi:hypothetical protein
MTIFATKDTIVNLEAVEHIETFVNPIAKDYRIDFYFIGKPKYDLVMVHADSEQQLERWMGEISFKMRNYH